MRIFEHPNLHNFTCPICGTADDKPVTLISISVTEDDGVIEARQVHVDCIELTSYRFPDGRAVISMLLEEVYE